MLDRRRIIQTTLVTLAVLSMCLLASRLKSLVDFIQQDVIQPGEYLFWILGLVVRTLHQAVLWGLGLAALIILVLYGLGFNWPVSPQKKKRIARGEENRVPEKGRVAYWQTQIRLLRQQGMESDFANYEFRRLAQSILDLRGGSSTGEEGEEIPAEAADAPASIRILFARPRARLANLKARRGYDVARFLPKRNKAAPADPGSDPLYELCHYLESHLEVPHDEQ